MSLIIGAKKKTEELPIFGRIEIEMFTKQSADIVQQGVPMETPASIRVMDMVRLSKTLSRYREVLIRLNAAIDAEEGKEESIVEAQEAALLVLNPPKIKQSNIIS